MADVARNISSSSKNHRGKNKEKHKHRKKDTPRKKRRFDDGRSIKDLTPRSYDRKFEAQNAHPSSSRHWDKSQVSHKTINETDYSRPQWDRHKEEMVSNNHTMLNGQINFSDRFDNHMSDERRSNSYNYQYNGATTDSLKAEIVDLKKQVEFFYEENEKFKYQLHNGITHGAANGDVNISFRDKNLERKLLPVLQELVSEVICQNITVEDLESFLFAKQNSTENIPEGELFALDNSTSEPNENARVPCYETSFQEVLQDPDVMNEVDAKKDKPAVSRFKACFNCSEEHRLQECPYPMDYKKIAMARKQRSSQFVSQVRYHVQGEQEKDLKPGVISDKLREALGVGADQVPSFIYHMRVLDYPPGWLEEATVESSGIALYGADVNTGGNPEANHHNMGSQVKYDPAKLIDFPGFNVPLPPNFIDESEYFGMPPLQDCQLRSVIEQYMPKVEPPKRKRKLVLHDEQAAKIQRFEEDMEVEDVTDINPPLPEDNPPPPLPPEDEFLPPLPSTLPNPPLPEDNPPPPPPEDKSLPPPPPEEDNPPEYSPESPTDDTEDFVVTEELECQVTECHDAEELEVVDIADSSTEEIKEIILSDCQSPAEDQEVYEEIIDSESQSGPGTPMSASVMEELTPVMERYKLKNDNDETTPSLKDLEELKKRLEMEISREGSNDSFAVNQSESHESSNAGSVSSLVSESSKPVVTTFSLENNKNNTSTCSLSSKTPSTSRQASITESCNETPVASRQDSATESCSETSLQINAEHENRSFENPSTSRTAEKNSETKSASENSISSVQIDTEWQEASFKTPSTSKMAEEGETMSLGQISRTASGSKLVSLGTPSLSRHSSFHKLPSYDNFAKNVTTHLNFENLPSSVGTYQKMKKVIKKVKEKINSFMQ